jgi:hypothetical protein
MKLAYRAGWSGMFGIVAAESRAKAVYQTLQGAKDAGYSPKFTDIRAKRAPEYDEWASRQLRNGCFTEEYVQRLIKSNTKITTS